MGCVGRGGRGVASVQAAREAGAEGCSGRRIERRGARSGAARASPTSSFDPSGGGTFGREFSLDPGDYS